MKPLNLKEFAESLMLGQHREFAIEILENIDLIEEYDPVNFMHNIDNMLTDDVLEGADNWRKIENIGDRLQLLSEIQDILDKQGFKGEPDGEVIDLIDTLSDAEKLLQDAKVWEGDLLESIALLLERVPAYDL